MHKFDILKSFLWLDLSHINDEVESEAFKLFKMLDFDNFVKAIQLTFAMINLIKYFPFLGIPIAVIIIYSLLNNSW